jgi:hypothetical protein
MLTAPFSAVCEDTTTIACHNRWLIVALARGVLQMYSLCAYDPCGGASCAQLPVRQLDVLSPPVTLIRLSSLLIPTRLASVCMVWRERGDRWMALGRNTCHQFPGADMLIEQPVTIVMPPFSVHQAAVGFNNLALLCSLCRTDPAPDLYIAGSSSQWSPQLIFEDSPAELLYSCATNVECGAEHVAVKFLDKSFIGLKILRSDNFLRLQKVPGKVLAVACSPWRTWILFNQC